jgi:hypothetical protein
LLFTQAGFIRQLGPGSIANTGTKGELVDLELTNEPGKISRTGSETGIMPTAHAESDLVERFAEVFGTCSPIAGAKLQISIPYS